jgi:putative hemolysin
MRKTYLVCKHCKKKGMARYTSRQSAGYECKYCKTRNTIAVYSLYLCAFPYGHRITHEEFETMEKYMKVNSYIDVENKYRVIWNDETQGFKTKES